MADEVERAGCGENVAFAECVFVGYEGCGAEGENARGEGVGVASMARIGAHTPVDTTKNHK